MSPDLGDPSFAMAATAATAHGGGAERSGYSAGAEEGAGCGEGKNFGFGSGEEARTAGAVDKKWASCAACAEGSRPMT